MFIQEKRHLEEEKKINSSPSRALSILAKAKALGYSRKRDEYRVPPADDVGGLPLVNEKVLTTLRGVAKEYLKQLFGKLFSGNFNLTTISFPIKCMRPISLLETFGTGACLVPLYLNKAVTLADPVERLKYVITAQIATFHITSNFLKPVIFINLLLK